MGIDLKIDLNYDARLNSREEKLRLYEEIYSKIAGKKKYSKQ